MDQLQFKFRWTPSLQATVSGRCVGRTVTTVCLVEPVDDAKAAVVCRRGAPVRRTISLEKVLSRKKTRTERRKGGGVRDFV